MNYLYLFIYNLLFIIYLFLLFVPHFFGTPDWESLNPTWSECRVAIHLENEIASENICITILCLPAPIPSTILISSIFCKSWQILALSFEPLWSI